MSSAQPVPAMYALSTGLMFPRVMVYEGPAKPLECFAVRIPNDAPQDQLVWLSEFNLWWEAGPFKPAYLQERLPKGMAWIDRVVGRDVDLVLIPYSRDNEYSRWAPIYHLLPPKLLRRFGVPEVRPRGDGRHRGSWPRVALTLGRRLPRESVPALSRAFAHYVWPMIGRGSMRGYTETDPIRVLAHDLGFWLPYLELVMRDLSRGFGRAVGHEVDGDEDGVASITDLRPARACRGGTLWEGEDEARDVARMVVERADNDGRLSSILEAVRSHREVDDFSEHWSYEREDFERKLFKKRSKVRISFIELNDSLPVVDEGCEIIGNQVWRDLFAVVDRRDRRIVVCLRRGITQVGDIARELGYANHSPVSKSLQRIRAAVAKELGD